MSNFAASDGLGVVVVGVVAALACAFGISGLRTGKFAIWFGRKIVAEKAVAVNEADQTETKVAKTTAKTVGYASKVFGAVIGVASILAIGAGATLIGTIVVNPTLGLITGLIITGACLHSLYQSMAK